MLTAVEIGNKIAVARKLKNLSQTELALEMAVTPQAVGKWERGESMPDITTFVRLASVLDVDLNYFGNIDQESFIAGGSETKHKIEEETPKLGWNMSGGIWVDADFSGLGSLGDRFSGANIKNCKFIGSDISRLILKNNNVLDSDFSRSDMKSSMIKGCNIQGSQFNGCNFSESEITGTNIQRCHFNGADLTGVTFYRTNFEKTEISGAKWNRTVFRQTGFDGIVFDGEIRDCSFEGLVPSKTIFRGACLRNCFFKNCSLKKVVFENCMADKMSVSFLKNSKADVESITVISE